MIYDQKFIKEGEYRLEFSDLTYLCPWHGFQLVNHKNLSIFSEKKGEFKTCSTKENHLHYFLFTTKTSKQVCHGPIGGNPKGLTFI